MSLIGCLGIALLFIVFLPILLLLSGASTLLRFLGLDVRTVAQAYRRAQSSQTQQREQPHSRRSAGQQQAQQAQRSAQGREKIFQRDNSEYVDFEELK